MRLQISSDRLPLILIALCLALYLPAMNWGISYPTAADRVHAWGNDDLVPLAPLTEMYQTFIRSFPDRNVAYPWFHFFLVACAYAPYLAFLLLTGGLHVGQPVYPFGFTDPVQSLINLQWIGRSVSLGLAIAAVLGIYSAGKTLWGRSSGFVAAVMTMLLFPVAYYARTGNIDTPVLGWTCLALAAGARWMQSGTNRSARWFGILAALAISTKEQVLGGFAFLGPALGLMHLLTPRTGGARDWRKGLVQSMWALGSFAVVYVLAQGILFDLDRYMKHTAVMVGVGTNAALFNRHPATAVGYAAQAADIFNHLIDVMGWPMLVSAGVGIVLALRSDRKALLFLLSTFGLMLLLMPVRLSRLHYLIPVGATLTLFAGYAFGRAFGAGGAMKKAAVVLAIVVAGYQSLRTIDLTHAMLFDSRYAAGDWFDRNAIAGDCILSFGAPLKMPHVQGNVCVKSVDLRADAAPAIASLAPAFIIAMPEDTDEYRLRVDWRQGPHSVYNTYLPDAVYENLVAGTLGYRLVAQFQTPRLLPWAYRPFLTYATVNPPIQIFARADRAAGQPTLEPWRTAPYYPPIRRVNEPPIRAQK
jgi:hypothetical protein